MNDPVKVQVVAQRLTWWKVALLLIWAGVMAWPLVWFITTLT